MLGNVAGTRLATSPGLASIAKGDVAVATQQQISSFYATLKGASNSFVAPKYQVLGKTRYDQKWIDQTTEAGIAGFGWKRPAKRPAALNPKSVKTEVDPYACFGAGRYQAMSEGRTCGDEPKPTTFRKRWYDRFLKHKPAQ